MLNYKKSASNSMILRQQKLAISRHSQQAGDTLIEVLFAITVFSLIVVGALALMNQGSASARRSLEMSLVRQQIDNQAETLRFLHDSYVANYRTGYSTSQNLTLAGPTGQFYNVIQEVKGTTAVIDLNDGSSVCPTPPSGSFIINTHTATVVTNPTILKPTETYAQLEFDKSDSNVLTSSGGLWIEGLRSANNTTDPNQKNTGYIDFYIRACWDSPGLDRPINLGTIVRLYEPRG